MQDLVLLQTFLGLSVAAGVVAGGSALNRTCSISYKKFQISMQYLCQVCKRGINATSTHTLDKCQYLHPCPLAQGYKYSLVLFVLL